MPRIPGLEERIDGIAGYPADNPAPNFQKLIEGSGITLVSLEQFRTEVSVEVVEIAVKFVITESTRIQGAN